MSNNYEFTGRVIGKTKTKVYNKNSLYFNQFYYLLQVELENRKEPKEILVFQGSKKFKKVEKAEYVDKRYLFFCSPKVANYQIVSYQLVDWRELSKELDSYGKEK